MLASRFYSYPDITRVTAGSAETVCALFQQSFTTRLKTCDYSVGEFRCAKITTKVTGFLAAN